MPRIFRHMVQRMLILFLLLGGMGFVCQEAQAAKEARAMWDANTKTLTFYYGEQKSGGTTHWSGTQITATGSTFPAWNNNSSIYSNITTVVFESSFASVRPTSCQSWFRGMPKLTTITGLKNFNTTNVTTMAYMFCLSTALTSLDLSSFNTANVTTMAYMFSGCSGLTSLNLSSFNTAKVTNMTSMFYDCSNLRTICVNESGWSTAAVLYGFAMFYSCTKLVGGNGTVFNSSYTDQTRACIDKPGQAGYLTCATVSGTCGASGSSIIWYIDCDGVLNIKGTGAMANYTTSSYAPWYGYRTSINSVVIGSGVTNIGNYAFYNCTNLSSITIPNSVTTIGNYAFRYCYALTQVTLPNAISSIGTGAFRNCTGLTSITIPSSVTSMGTYIFDGATNLTDVYLLWTGTKILTRPSNFIATNRKVHIPCGTLSDYIAKGWNVNTIIEKIGEGTCGAPGHESDITWSISCDGVLTISGTGAMENWTNSGFVPWKDHRSSITSVNIDEHITSVGAYAFYGCSNMTSIKLPSNITSIGQYTFYNCSRLKSINLPNSVTSIGAYAFYGCSNVTSIKLPSNITSIGQYTFYNCSRLKSINLPNSVTSIGESAFYYCNNLKSITLPSSLKTIEQYAFYHSTGWPESLTLPSTITTIGAAAFGLCIPITSITIPPSVTSIGNSAFNISSLTDLYVSWSSASSVPNWTTMTPAAQQSSIILHVPCGTGSFYTAKTGWQDYMMQSDCSGNPYTITVTSANPSVGFVSIDGGTLGTSVSKTMNQDNSCMITAVPNDACHDFAQWNDGNTKNPRTVCPNTNTTYTATFAADNTTRSGTFGSANLSWSFSCDSVLTISGSGDMPSSANTGIFPWNNFRNKIKHVVIGEGVTSIGNNAFRDLSNLVSVSNPSTLRTIGDYAFIYCRKLETFNFPNGLQKIGTTSNGHTFYECNSLQSVYIPASVTEIKKDVFLRCHSVTSMVVDPANTVYDSRDNCNAIIETATNTLWYGCRNTVIPDGVVTVKDWAFEYQHNLKSIRISNTVQFLGTNGTGGIFKECENLKDIYVEWTNNIPAWNQLTRWYEHTNLDGTIRLHVPCGYKALYEATTGWNNYQIIDDHLMGGMCGAQGSNVTWALSCNGVLTIRGLGAMKDYTHTNNLPWVSHRDVITTIIIEEGVTTIGDRAFGYSTNATSVTIPSSVTSIGDYAFIGCSSLQEITIPNTINALGINMLYACSSLTDIYASWILEIPTWPSNFTNNSPQSSVTLHVPCEVLENYKEANGWKDYTIEGEGTNTVTVLSADPEMGDVMITIP